MKKLVFYFILGLHYSSGTNFNNQIKHEGLSIKTSCLIIGGLFVAGTTGYFLARNSYKEIQKRNDTENKKIKELITELQNTKEELVLCKELIDEIENPDKKDMYYLTHKLHNMHLNAQNADLQKLLKEIKTTLSSSDFSQNKNGSVCLRSSDIVTKIEQKLLSF